ncbi:hypothetical protein [Corynebacterium liangguodongii]|uniref:Uncharacterized protein n=1 Tax=Corynebacterium liangguodongii TaxID=2079535 RepID=A0A2S0WEM2_9CORY|nr:hypothetical protein [Corynebacterium liangguodongii]AWB84228.1 hypothetical protein C3E79_06825 [Corynebacterium liangguodongii]PWC00237.1 hypothetical protein DF219_03460 [Corynebacterium liangguodongii]
MRDDDPVTTPPPPCGSGEGPRAGTIATKGAIALAALVVLIAVACAAWWLGRGAAQSRGDEAAASLVVITTVEQPSASESGQDPAEESPTEASPRNEPAAATLGPCEPAPSNPRAGEVIEVYCDGAWKIVGKAHTDSLAVAIWDGAHWAPYDSHSIHSLSQLACFERERLEAAHAPDSLLKVMDAHQMICVAETAASQPVPRDPRTQGSGDWLPIPSCSGEYVLIVGSVLVSSGQDPQPPVYQAMARHSGAQATYPHQCASLRPEKDGALVYPVYVDYGSDRAGVCAAEARGEGYARQLRQVADYTSPC